MPLTITDVANSLTAHYNTQVAKHVVHQTRQAGFDLIATNLQALKDAIRENASQARLKVLANDISISVAYFVLDLLDK